jgi:alkaline phosphatase D
MVSRRRFLAGGAVLVLAPQTAIEALANGRSRPLLRGGRFRQGVLSGEPTPRGITLLTIVDEVSGSGSVRLEVARDRDFRNVVARKTIATSGRRGHSVKARVGGLRPDERYFYRFETRDRHSPVGRFQTALPSDSNRPVKFAFFSCSEYTHGYYNAFEAMARDDVDFVVCLGDYIYAEAYHSVAGGTGVRDDTIGEANPQNPDVASEALTLADYRAKYALYRSDKALRALHAKFPMIAIWDDHEVQDNYAGAAPGGGLDASKRWSAARRRSGYRAFFEAMPFFALDGDRIYRSERHGRNVDLIMLDQRQYRADQPCGDAVAPACPDWDQPRPFLGSRQMDWLKSRLRRSKARWKVIGSQTMMMPAKIGPDTYFGFDSWQGYPREREELLAAIRGVDDVVFITGDIHLFLAGDARTDMGRGESVAVEFVGGSVTSTNFGEMVNDGNPQTTPATIDALRSFNPWVDQADFDHHGYARVEASRTAFECTLERMETIKRRTRAQLGTNGFRYRLERGQKSIKGVNGPPG